MVCAYPVPDTHALSEDACVRFAPAMRPTENAAGMAGGSKPSTLRPGYGGRSMLTRRGAMGLVASSTFLFAGSVRAVAQPAPQVLFRKSASALASDSPEMNALRSAIPEMRQSGFWDRMVAIHSNNWRQHHSWLFLPWHRAFLYEFELAVRRLTYDGFRMPYLDWDADTIPATLYEPPFAHDGRTHGPGDSMRAFQGTGGWFNESAPRPFADFFGQPDYGGDDESYGHNLVHVFVGGDMGNILTAPRDPLFWFHHSNVDRLWWYWDQQYGCHSADCYPADWQSEMVRGIVDPDGSALAPIPVRSLLTTAPMGYDYESLPMERMVMAAAPPLGSHPPRLVPRPPYATTLRLIADRTPTAIISLPRELVTRLLTASKAEVNAPMLVRSSASAPHEIRISLMGRTTLQQDRIFAMPMGGGMGNMRGGMNAANSSYAKNIGTMFESLARNASPEVAAATVAQEPLTLRVDAIPLAGSPSAARPILTQCTCAVTAKTWQAER